MELVATLLILGFVLLFLETYLPGLIAGATGVVCLIVGIVVAFSRFGRETGFAVLLGTTLLLALSSWWYLRFFPESRMAQRFVSKSVVGDIGTERPELVNRRGIAQSALRPSGIALFDGERVDVITEGTHVAAGTGVRIVRVEGARVIVRAEA